VETRVSWLVEVDLSPPALSPRPDWDAVIAARAEHARASRWKARRIAPSDLGPEEGWLVALDDVSGRAAVTRRALDEEEGRGPFDHTMYRLFFTIQAATSEQAMAYAVDRCAAPPDWAVVAWAEPLGS
jgi:hypothetical protein